MDKKQWANKVADAVYNARVMNNTMIVYNTDTELFSYQSSLTPVYDNEIIVDGNCSDDGFGMMIEDGKDSETGTTESEFSDGLYTGDMFPDYWTQTVECIEANAS